MVASGLLLASLVTLALGKSTARNLRLHETRQGAPSGFSLTGSADPDQTLRLRLALVQGNTAELERKLYDVSTPSSANYGKHLSKSDVQQLVAPAQGSVDAVNSWLKENGITAKTTSAAGDWLSFEVPVNKANELFDADFSVFKHDDTGVEAVRTLSYSIPAELQGHLDLVHPTVTFPNPNGHLPVFKAPIESKRDVPANCSNTITPACLQALYNIPSDAATQSSNKLAVTGYFEQYANQQDLMSFLGQFRPDIPSNTTFALQTIDGGSNSQNRSDAGLEANLDIQYTVGVATGVPTTFISVGDQNQDGDLWGFLDVINFLLAEDAPPNVITTSYGLDENTLSLKLAQNLCNAYAQLGARGVSILFASGDGGVGGIFNDCVTEFAPTFPAGCPYITSVGATHGAPETAADFSTGGFSNYFGVPPYQRSAAQGYLAALGSTHRGLFNASGRGFPDVATQGVHFETVRNGSASVVSGTSASSPTFAAIVALLNDRRVAAGMSPLGFLNPFLYSTGGAAAFNDVTTGSNPGCGTDGFPAKEGWDPVTGLGTPDFRRLARAVSVGL